MDPLVTYIMPIVLVVEDEPLVRMTTVDGLEDAGFHVLEAGGADDALALLEDHSEDIEVLFTDVRMPGSMDGLELAKEVYRRWPHILLLVSSGHARPGIEDMPDHGEFVPKPYLTASIVRHIHTMMQNVRRGHP
jgi:two-component system, response regulator PdtaR